MATGLTTSLVLILAVNANVEQDYIGRYVMTIKWNTEARVDQKVVRKLELGEVYQVTKVEGQRLWFNKSVDGWVRVEDVVLYEKAIDHFNRLVQQDPSATNFHDRGVAWTAKGEPENAIGDFNEAIRRQPSAAAYNNRGLAWQDKGDYDRAMADYNAAIGIDSKYALAYNNRGVIWQNKGDYDKAIADYNEAIRIDPKYTLAYNNRGLVWQIKGDYDKAIADHNEAIRIDPKNALAYNNLAWVFATVSSVTRRDGPQAVELATKACELTDWRNDQFIGTLSAAYAETGQFSQAIDYLNKAVAMNPYSFVEVRGQMLSLFKSGKPYRMRALELTSE